MLRVSSVSSPIMGKGVFNEQASLWQDRRLGSLAIYLLLGSLVS